MNDTKKPGLDAVNVSFLDPTSKALPLVITPRWDASLEFLSSWLDCNRTWVDDQILRYGAVLIRGFDINTAVDFENATLALQPNLCDAYRGTSPRSLKEGTTYAFSAADVPVNYPIAQHIEMSFLKAPPRQLYFGCLKASSKPGGETSLCDFRKVYQDLPEELRITFLQKRIRYTRTHARVGEHFTYDVGAMLDWPSLFETDDRSEVEKICREEESPKVEWIGPEKDTFHQQWVDDPVQQHPITGEMVWFNHSQVFHWTTFPSELWYAFGRIRDFHLLLHFVLVATFTFLKYGLLGFKMALDTSFGDGSPITKKEMDQVRTAIHKNMVFSRWQKGDILCIDNFSTSHGRQPTYDKGRQVVVAWSHPFDKTSSQLEHSPKIDLQGILGEADPEEVNEMPGLVVATPDTTPESTLTSEEAQELKEAFLHNRFDKHMAMAFSKRENNKKYHKHTASCPNLLLSDSDFWKED